MAAAAATTRDALAPQMLAARAVELLQRDRWSPDELEAYQRARLRNLLGHVVARSPYYREALGSDAAGAELADLPTLPKTRLMEEFDRIVTDPRLRLADLEPFLAEANAGARYLDEYRVFSTSGTTGLPGLFLYSQREFAQAVAVTVRTFARLGMTPRTRIVGVGAPGSIHISNQVIAAMGAGGSGVSVTTPLEETVAVLNAYQPEIVGGYASALAILAEEQLQGRLGITPSVVLTGSEVLTEDAAARIERAWTKPVQAYFSTEVIVIASDSLDRVGMHVCEEAIVEDVDEAQRPVPPGTPGAKVLLTNVVHCTQPQIRDGLSDPVVTSDRADPHAR